MTARAVMVLGTTSGAGKSWLATALCRWYARQGLKVAPYKAQNMSNNARVVPRPDGGVGEIGSAQYFQALAAGVAPDVRMNPVLLKPEHDRGSQVLVNGQVRDDLRAVPWHARGELLWAPARAALHALMADHEVVVLEGAGSPAEINLRASDYVNGRSAREAQAACLLVTDIDRGGAFAHLYGTHQLLPPEEQALLRGHVLNRFRGDPGLLPPGPAQLHALTGVPTLAVLPMWRGHGLPEEDGLHDAPPARPGPPGSTPLRVAVLACPRLSNLDEFQPLHQVPGLQLVWARTPAQLQGADWIVLPGSKATRADLAWLRAQGLAEPIQAHARAGRPLLAICGGLQMAGELLDDPAGVEGAPGQSAGLGLLPLHTHFAADKRLLPGRCTFGAVGGPWAALAGVAWPGYEIHQGRSRPMRLGEPAPWPVQPGAHENAHAAGLQAVLHNAAGEPIGWQRGSVLAVYAHGLFESPAVLRALFGAQVPTLDSVFDGLADFIDQHFSPGSLAGLLEGRPLTPWSPPGA